MFCDRSDLLTESDVEQKLVWPFLTTPAPEGLGYAAAEVLTKTSIRRLEIGKGDKRRLHYPDYIVLLAGLPVLVIEAKEPNDANLDEALDEARMYAAKLNSLFPAGVNPCIRVAATNGQHIVSTAADSTSVDHDVALENMTVSDIGFSALVDALGRQALQRHADRLRDKLAKRPFERPVSLLGGLSVRNEEIGHNTFGSRLATNFRHIFSPTTLQDRAYLVKNAYVRSLRRERYVEPIDRLIREIVPPSVSHVASMEDSQRPQEIEHVLGRGRALEHQIMLLVGSVGSGKSTFVDYLVNVALAKEVLAKTTWLRIDMNLAPSQKEFADDWLLRQIIGELKASQSDVDLDELDQLQKVYGVELNKLKRGALALLPPDSIEYRTRLADELLALQRNKLATAHALSRYLCTERSKLLVIVLDNCDKRDLEQQLLMFQLAHWTQQELRCVVILPLRDSTYDLHRNKPPLDTAQKDLVFRIEPPRLTEVLSSRIALALREMESTTKEKVITYALPNGMKVTYPADDQGMYLTCILRSLYEHDKFLRRILTGLAGRDVRRALELFVEFCSSGHIGEDEIFKIRQKEGRHTLPLPLVSRVLLRVNRRFYDGDTAHVKNIFQCVPADPLPDHFVRVAILRYLHTRQKKKGPSGLRGYHKTSALVQQLVMLGHDAERIRAELRYLVNARCVVAEHQRLDVIDDADLVSIASAGAVHLEIIGHLDYLAACAEDTYFADRDAAHRIATRIGAGRGAHFSEVTIFDNAEEIVKYLDAHAASWPVRSSEFLAEGALEELHDLKEPKNAVGAARRRRQALRESGRLFLGNLFYGTTEQDIAGLFSGLGFDLLDVHLPHDEKGVARGIAFVTLKSPKQLDDAIAKTHGALLRGRTIRVELAAPKEDRSTPSTE